MGPDLLMCWLKCDFFNGTMSTLRFMLEYSAYILSNCAFSRILFTMLFLIGVAGVIWVFNHLTICSFLILTITVSSCLFFVPMVLLGVCALQNIVVQTIVIVIQTNFIALFFIIIYNLQVEFSNLIY